MRPKRGAGRAGTRDLRRRPGGARPLFGSIPRRMEGGTGPAAAGSGRLLSSAQGGRQRTGARARPGDIGPGGLRRAARPPSSSSLEHTSSEDLEVKLPSHIIHFGYSDLMTLSEMDYHVKRASRLNRAGAWTRHRGEGLPGRGVALLSWRGAPRGWWMSVLAAGWSGGTGGAPCADWVESLTPDELKGFVRSRIRQARTECGWTQKELADRLGLASNVSIARYESGERSVDLDTLARIASATARPVAWFLEEKPAPDDLVDLVDQVRLAEASLRGIRRSLEALARARAD